MNKTSIEYLGYTWNPTTGCSPVSPGCKHCWAKRQAQRFKGRYGYPLDDPFRPIFHPERLDQPLKIKKPSVIGVSFMGDLFHEKVEEKSVLAVWQAMGEFYRNGEIQPMENRPGHTYLVLTKRPQRMRDFCIRRYPAGFERSNVWLGVSIEDQKTADERIPLLLQTPAAKRWVSYEPALGPVDLEPYLPVDTIGGVEMEHWPDFVIAGCESGRGRRPARMEWFVDLIKQCRRSGVSCYVKQMEVKGEIFKSLPFDVRL